MAKKLKIRLKRSVIGFNYRQRRTVKALGLKKVNSEVIHEDSPQIRGMVKSIKHLLSVEEIEG
ncbi:50S ribosomal protein L30 [Kosmotoga pacifica]|uniref:Large ribosomal subunit protein uL30 n=1 Tax=Kosmotoga pacifica TaxID=1330330 RepID=A0A0G2ZEB9_9BACT|nr:50S ribosomal protein L30 [Kosmotoga pacifica]AKI97904.1 50S ribosomal protein L30 [Kosmotoga pacifica]